MQVNGKIRCDTPKFTLHVPVKGIYQFQMKRCNSSLHTLRSISILLLINTNNVTTTNTPPYSPWTKTSKSHPVEVLWNHRQKREHDYMVPVLSASFRERPDGQGARSGLNHRAGLQHSELGSKAIGRNMATAFLRVSSASQSELGCQIFRRVLAPEEAGGPSATENGQ